MPKGKLNHPPVRVLDAGNVILVNNSSLSLQFQNVPLLSALASTLLCVWERALAVCQGHHTWLRSPLYKRPKGLTAQDKWMLFFFREKKKKKSQMSECLWSPLQSLFRVVDLKCLSLVKYPRQREEPPPQRCIKSREFKGKRNVAII